MKYTYIDGSGNTYKLLNSMLSYSPMTKANSSSGLYDGGDPFSKELTKEQLIGLIDVFERALWQEEAHTSKRTMGSGTLYKIVGDENSRIYLSMRSDAKNEIENQLKKIKEG